MSLPPTSLLYFLETGLIQQGERCISKVVEVPKGICFSTFQPNWKSVKESSNRPGPALTDNSNLAKSVLVSPSSSDVSRQTNFDSTSRGSFNGFKDGKASINRERKIKTSGRDNFREKLFLEGISKDTAECIISAKRQGSITHYESAWGKWDSWCSRKQVDPISGPLNSLLDFLAELFHSGLEWSTIAGYRSSISAFHDSIEGLNTLVFALSLKGFLIKDHQFQDIHLYRTFRKY